METLVYSCHSEHVFIKQSISKCVKKSTYTVIYTSNSININGRRCRTPEHYVFVLQRTRCFYIKTYSRLIYKIEAV